LGFEAFLMGPSAAVAWVVVIIVNIFTIIFLRLLAREQA
jgi:ABC-type sugar transport system permease subunit